MVKIVLTIKVWQIIKVYSFIYSKIRYLLSYPKIVVNTFVSAIKKTSLYFLFKKVFIFDFEYHEQTINLYRKKLLYIINNYRR